MSKRRKDPLKKVNKDEIFVFTYNPVDSLAESTINEYDSLKAFRDKLINGKPLGTDFSDENTLFDKTIDIAAANEGYGFGRTWREQDSVGFQRFVDKLAEEPNKVFSDPDIKNKLLSDVLDNISFLESIYGSNLEDLDIENHKTFTDEFNRAGVKVLSREFGEVIPQHVNSPEEFKAAMKKLPKGSNVMFMDHFSSNKMFGLPLDEFAQSFKDADVDLCIGGTCHGERVSKELSKSSPNTTFLLAPEDQIWPGFNPGSSNFRNAVFPTGNVQVGPDIEGLKYGGMTKRKKNNKYPLGGITGINPLGQGSLEDIFGALLQNGGIQGLGLPSLGGTTPGVTSSPGVSATVLGQSVTPNVVPIAPDLQGGGAQIGGVGTQSLPGVVGVGGGLDLSTLLPLASQLFNNDRNNPNAGNVDPLKDIAAYRQNPYQGFLAENGMSTGGVPPLGFINIDSLNTGPTTLPSTFLLGSPYAFGPQSLSNGGVPNAGLGGFFKKVGKGIGKVFKGIGDFALTQIGAGDVIQDSFVDNSRFLSGFANVTGTLGQLALNAVAPGLGAGVSMLGSGLNSAFGNNSGGPGGPGGAGANGVIPAGGNILDVAGVPGNIQTSGLFDPNTTLGGTFGQGMFGQVAPLSFQNVGSVTSGKYGGRIKKSKKKYANGGILPLIDEGLIGIQTEVVGKVPEMIIHPEGSITKVNATKPHDKMDDDEITDVVTVGSYIASAQKRMQISKKEAREYFLGYKDMPYEELKKGKIPEETTFADIFPKNKGDKYKLTPAELAEKIRKRYNVVDYDVMDVFTENTNKENLKSRVPFLSSLIEISEEKMPRPTAKQLVKDQIKAENEQTGEFEFGGPTDPPLTSRDNTTVNNNFDPTMVINLVPIAKQPLLKVNDILTEAFGSKNKAKDHVDKQNKLINKYNNFISDNGFEGQYVDPTTLPTLSDLEWFSPKEFSNLTKTQINTARQVKALDDISNEFFSSGSSKTKAANKVYEKKYGGYKYGGHVNIPKAPFGGDFLGALGNLFSNGNLGNTLGTVGSVLGSTFGASPGTIPGPNAFGANLPTTAIDPLSASLINQAFPLNTAGNIQNIQSQQGSLQNALSNLTGLTGDLQNLNQQGTAVGVAGLLGQQTNLPGINFDFSRLENFDTRTPQSFINQAATPTIDLNAAIDRLGSRAGVALASNVNAQGVAGRNNAAINAFNQQQNADLGIANTITQGRNQETQLNQAIDAQEIAARNNQLSGIAGQVQGGLSNQGNILSNSFTTGTSLDMQLANLAGQIPRAIAQDALGLASTRQSLLQQQNALDFLRAGQIPQQQPSTPQVQTSSPDVSGSVLGQLFPNGFNFGQGPGSVDPSISGNLPPGVIGINPNAGTYNQGIGAGGIGLGAGFGNNPLDPYGSLFGGPYTGIPQGGPSQGGQVGGQGQPLGGNPFMLPPCLLDPSIPC